MPPYGPPPHGLPPYPGYGFGAQLVRRTNPVAIAALAVGLCGLFFPPAAPVGVVLGIVALVQLRKTSEGGTGQAVGGMVAGGLFSVVWGGLLALAIVVGSTEDDYYSSSEPTAPSSSEPTAPSSSEPTAPSSSSPDALYIDDLIVGQCFDDGAEEDEVVPLSCAGPHDGEVYAVVTLPAQTWPGEREVSKQSGKACDREFQPYVGIGVDDSELETATWYPRLASWSRGDRSVYCAAYGPDSEQLDQTVKGSKR
ncbi:uncharacterized protein DUF4190 [Kribbella amoyensis]|uniref:Uncharacterized protein DUF4190 n=1 Tax=Kribbella amoyensis TaxID=996641 RepID=A0A561BQL2_9ACTN|nr:DUF4190 domain-containing protein [Kribbella amoyensis]TWD81155.1 uncharacterized protein DUF4190 [Kribbella amoyensis]